MNHTLMNNICCCPLQITLKKSNYWVFCAGPILGAPLWLLEMPDNQNITWLSPRRLSYDNFNYDEQVLWETKYMRSADIILFWIPEEIEHIEGRQYALTTRTEFGEYLARGKKVIFGCYQDFPGENYFKTKLELYHQDSNIYRSLDECIKAILTYIDECENNFQIFFTSDTHFSSERTLELSKRPYLTVDDMDWDMIIKWNNKVKPHDMVYHLGDFGNDLYIHLLNGQIHFIEGNYERDGKEPVPKYVHIISDKEILLEFDNKQRYILCHEPTKGLLLKEDYSLCPILFGHIHGRQKVKEFCGLDVGVDCNNFAPISQEEVDFYINAINKGYYDKDVWC